MVEAETIVNPERFGRYILLDKIGEGGMAEVFRAVMPGAEGFKRTFVVKRILANLSKRPAFVEMFIREARIGSMLNHPNIVSVYDFGNVDGSYFLAMEYLSGRDVLSVIRRLRDTQRPFPIPVATFIAQKVAAGLGYAHALTDGEGKSLDIIHRDVSPSNIMCLREGGVKLLDFGIAKSTEENLPDSTEQGSFKGKIAYIAPERVRGEPFDGRSDLYSLGVVLWEMLTCKRLFRGSNDVETWRKVVEMPVEPPSRIRPEIPASLDAVVMRALARNPVERYANGHVMSDDLEAVLAETKFQSRMFTRLLVDLFGSARRSSQLAMSTLGPELLAEMELSQVSSVGQPGPTTGTASVPKPPFLSRRGWVALGAACLVALVGLYLGGSLGMSKRHVPAGPPPVVVPAPAPAPPAPTAPPPSVPIEAVPPSPAGEAEANAAAATAPAKTARKGRRSSHKPESPRVREQRITKGLSIDPFAEAAKRGSP